MNHLKRPHQNMAEMAIFDAQIDDLSILLNGLKPGVEACVLHPKEDGLAQISAILASRKEIRTLHLISHGAPGQLFMGRSPITAQDLTVETLKQWQPSLSSDAEILIYGCNVAAGADGEAFLAKLNALLQANIAASTTPVGHAAHGANWELDTATHLQSDLPFTDEALAHFSGILMPDADNDSFDDDVDLDADGDGILNSAEGFVPSSNISLSYVGTSDNTITYSDGTYTVQFTALEEATVSDQRVFFRDFSDSESSLRITSNSPISSISFTDMDDMDAGTPRDTLGFDVDGEWSDYGGLDSYETDGTQLNGAPTLPSGVILSQIAERGVVSPVLTNINGAENNHSATFTLDSASTDFRLIYEDIEKGDGAAAEFNMGASITIAASARDTDRDGIPDYLDLDSDNDGIPDNLEAQATNAYVAPSGNDTDMDGLDDNYEGSGDEGLSPVNSDTDAAPDYIDTDSNDNGTGDSEEAGLTLGNLTVGANGLDDDVEAADDYSDPSGTFTDLTSLPDADGDLNFGGDVDFRDDTFTDTVAPDAPVITDPTLTDDLSPTISGTAEANATVELFIGGVSVGTTTTDGNGDWSVEISAQPSEGDYTVTATATDAANNRSDNSDPFDFTIFAEDVNGTIGVVLSATSLRLSEPTSIVSGNNLSTAPTSTTFTVALEDQPTSDVALNLSSSDIGEATLSTSTLTFTPDNWDQPQTVTVQAIADEMYDPTQDITVTVSTDTANNARGFANMDDQTIAVAVEHVGPTPGRDRLVYGSGRDRIFAMDDDDHINGGAGNDRISGQGGSDRLFGDMGNDRLLGRAGADNLIGGAGDDRLLGGADNDRLSGNAGNDRLVGAAGIDVLFGGTGNDTLVGGSGNDSLLAGAGIDLVRGNLGDDLLSGGADDDRMLGGLGNDRINGEGGNDLLRGGEGQDTLKGGSGDDRIAGEMGDDIIFSGAGRDLIVVRKNQGFDQITDFEDGFDRILLAGIGFKSLTLQQQQGNVLISQGDERLALLHNVNADQLTQADFV